MISENTPYKLAEILRDTWPQLFHVKGFKNGRNNTTTTKEGMV